jgi:hypothetical protein
LVPGSAAARSRECLPPEVCPAADSQPAPTRTLAASLDDLARGRHRHGLAEDSSVDCEGVAQLLSACQVDELPAEQRMAVAEHVWQCPACRQRWGLDVSTSGSDGGVPGTSDSADSGGGAVLRGTDRSEDELTTAEGPAWPPRDLGGFEILDRLGRGGMGTVFRARQPSVDRVVALKVLTSGCAWDGVSVTRFTREARAAAAVGHPNIIAVYDVSQDRGWHYIAMEYVDGGSLADALRRGGSLSPSRVLDLMKQVVAGLAEAHRIGVLHRDVKPSNILLTSKGWAKLADFGLAKRPAVDPSVTVAEAPLGTPMYMAPEALRGEEFSPRSDLYCLGATFYHAIAGRPPFTGSTGAELVAKHLEASPPPLVDLVPGVPPPLARIIHRLLAKDPADRFESAEDLLKALEAVRLPVTPRPTVGFHGLRAMARRRPKTLLAVVLLFLAAIGTLAAMLAWPNGKFPPSDPVSLFDGRALDGWRAVSLFPGDGPPGRVQVRDGQIILSPGSPYTGIVWAGEFPTADYEVVIEAKRLGGSQDFCSMTFPVGGSRCTLLVGAGTDLVRLKLVDGDYFDGLSPPGGFDEDRWYRVSLRVTRSRLEVWIDEHEAIALERTGHELTTAPSFDLVKPFGVNSYETTAAIRRIELRRLPSEPQ